MLKLNPIIEFFLTPLHIGSLNVIKEEDVKEPTRRRQIVIMLLIEVFHGFSWKWSLSEIEVDIMSKKDYMMGM